MQKLNPILSESSVLVLTCFFLLSFGATAQTVSGLITSSDKQAVIGAYITSGAQGASSDIDGKYTLSLASGTHEITCSFIGLKTTTKTMRIN